MSKPASRHFRLDHPYLLLTLTVLFWSGNWVVGRGLRGEVPPVALNFWRWVIALLCLLPFMWPHRKAVLHALKTRLTTLVALAVLGISGYNTLTYIGLQFTTATNGVLLNAFIPIVILGLAWAFLGRKVGRLEALGVLVSLAGVTLIVAHGELAFLLALKVNVGDLWVLASVFVWAGYTLLLQRVPKELPPLALLGALCAIGVICLLPLYAWELSQGLRIQVTPMSFAAIAYTGLFPAFLGYIFWNRGVAEVGAARAGLFIHLMPPFTAALSAIFLGEMPQLYHFFGLLLIVGGILLGTRKT